MTLNSMTGFGRAEGQAEGWSWIIEARSVNGRGLEARFRAPAGFEGLERATREAAQALFSRGQLNVSLQMRREGAQAAIRINTALLEDYARLAETLVLEGKAAQPSADGLLSLRGVIEAAEDTVGAEARDMLGKAIGADIRAALQAMADARAQEGQGLTAILDSMLDQIEALVNEAREIAEASPTTLRDLFAERLRELVGEAASEERILQEAGVLALKSDVREELDRLAHHVGVARSHLNEGKAVGRKLEFLAQEFMREANTLCSKAATNALTVTGLKLKTTIDQMREQVQNVE